MPVDERIIRIAANLAAIRAEFKNAQRALAPLWSQVDALVAEWARIAPNVAAAEREDRIFAIFLDTCATEKDRRWAVKVHRPSLHRSG